MNNNNKEEVLYIEQHEFDEEHDMVKLTDIRKPTNKIQSISLPEEYEEKMPLLKEIYPPKKKILKKEQ